MGNKISKKTERGEGKREKLIEKYNQEGNVEEEENVDEAPLSPVSRFKLKKNENLSFTVESPIGNFDITKFLEGNEKNLKEQLEERDSSEFVSIGNYESKTMFTKRTRSVRLYPGEIIDAIIVNGQHIGGQGGNRSDVLILRKYEFIEYIEIDFCNYYGHSVIGRLFLRTNQKRELKGGLAKTHVIETFKREGLINFIGGRSDGGPKWKYLNFLEISVEPRPNSIDYEDLDESERTIFVLEEDEYVERATLRLPGREFDIPTLLLLE